jgi:hypothetical protein
MNIKLNREEELLIKGLLESHKSDNPHISEIWNTTTDLINKINQAGLVQLERQPKVFRLKQYMFTFEEGGWNTVYAKTRKGAIRAALKEYKDSETLNPRIDSFHVATEEGLKSAMSLFY